MYLHVYNWIFPGIEKCDPITVIWCLISGNTDSDPYLQQLFDQWICQNYQLFCRASGKLLSRLQQNEAPLVLLKQLCKTTPPPQHFLGNNDISQTEE